MIVIGSSPQLSVSAVKLLKRGDLQRLETERVAHPTLCVSVYRWQSEKKEDSRNLSSWSGKPIKNVAWVDTTVTDVTWHQVEK